MRIGQYVKITKTNTEPVKDNNELNAKHPTGLGWNKQMDKLIGQTYKIIKIDTYGSDNKTGYILDCPSDEDGELEYWTWEKDWLQPSTKAAYIATKI